MEKKIKKIKIFGDSDCYGLTDKLSFTIRLTVEMRDEVDGACLREAVNIVEQRFSYLKVSLKKDIKEFYYTENPLPWVVLHTDKAVPLNCKESNYQLLAFSWYGNTIYINCYHGQMDGGGVYNVMQSLLLYYCRARYDSALTVPGTFLLEDEVDPEEYRDAYLDFYNKYRSCAHKSHTVPLPRQRHVYPLKLQQTSHITSERRSNLKLAIPQDVLMQYCSSYDGSPVTALAAMLAEAIYRVHPDTKKDIVVGMPVNLRPAMGLKKSHCNTYRKIYFTYDERIRCKDFETIGTIFRGIVIRESDHDVLKSEIYSYCKMLKILNLIPFTAIKQLAARFEAKSMMNAETADITYVGKCDYGEMNQYIQSIYPDVDGYGIGIIVILSALDNKFFLSIDQDWDDMRYINSFLSVLSERGVTFKITSEADFNISLLSF